MYQISTVACACYTCSLLSACSLLACLHTCNSPVCAVEAQKRLCRARNLGLLEELEQREESGTEPEAVHHQ